MSERIETGGPAFPVECSYSDDPDRGLRGIQTGPSHGWEMGMTLRDYFAAKAMASPIVTFLTDSKTISPEEFLIHAAACYQMADAMLAAREVKP